MRPVDWAFLNVAKADEAFGEQAWLTFYLSGSSDDHSSMRKGLEALSATNLEGAEGGFVYAKVPISLARDDAEERIEKVRQLAADANVEIDVIDLDSGSEVDRSTFYTLWTAG